jgi:hypothetical protein
MYPTIGTLFEVAFKYPRPPNAKLPDESIANDRIEKLPVDPSPKYNGNCYVKHNVDDAIFMFNLKNR